MNNPYTGRPLTRTNETNIEIFNDTLERVKTIPVPESVYYPGGEVSEPFPETRYDTQISVTTQRTVEAAETIGGERVGILNFASATRVGGGVTTGSSAQEEAICRVTNLYGALSDCKRRGWYYVKPGDPRYTDNIIYTKGVSVVKTDAKNPQPLDPGEYWCLDVVTCAAPNQRFGAMHDDDVYALFRARIAKVLTVFAVNGNADIVLGAWGCGAFRNPPEVVAAAFKDELTERFSGGFRKIVFAIYATRGDDNNLTAFRREFPAAAAPNLRY
jgi:uncharacterized protein (TIGR02452 family)